MTKHPVTQDTGHDEIEALRRQVDQLRDAEQRCRRAEAALAALEARNRLLGDSTPLGIFTVDSQGWITGLNRKMQEIFNWLSIDAPQAISLFTCGQPAVAAMVADIQRCIDQRRPMIADHRCTGPQERDIYLRSHLSPVSVDTGKVDSVMAIVEDVSDLKRTEAALQESEKRYRQLFQSAPIPLIEWDVSRLKAYLEELRSTGVVDIQDFLYRNPRQVHHCWSLIKTVDYNQAFLALMGVADRRETIGSFLPTDSTLFWDMAREIVVAAAEGKMTEERETSLVTTAGQTKILLGKSLPVTGHEDTLERVAIALVDITRRKAAEEALRESERRFREQALRDSLTGLYNQRYLYRSLARWIGPDGVVDTPVSLIFMDLDHFKTVVDTHGHLNGSRAIQKVAQTIDSCIQEPAFAVAYAGDEFVVVLPGTDHSPALRKAEEIRATMDAARYVLDRGIEIRLSASFGVATYPHHARDVNALIAAADQALFKVKTSGKGAIGRCESPL